MQRASVSFWPVDNNAMGGVTLDFNVGGVQGIDEQWVRDIADALAPLVPTDALGWTSVAEVSSITIYPDPYGIQPNESEE